MIINERDTCRVCNSPVHLVVDFGEICINDFPQSSHDPVSSAPMVLDQCEKCDLVQLRHTVDPKVLYGEHYWYESGLNSKLKDNLIDIAKIINTYTDKGDTVLDIGANDGTLLHRVVNDRVRVGCEPAPNLWDKLKDNCDIMIPEMWDQKYLDQYICTHPSTEYINNKAKAITAIGMFYDMDNPNDFISSVKEALTDDGIFIAQLMTLAPMLRMRDLGNVCHEHLEYYSYASLVELYERNGLEIYHVEENDIQGGSYQLWARHLKDGSISYDEDISTLKDFFSEIEHNGKVLRDTLDKYRDMNCYVYGASTKGNTMLQLWNLGKYFKGAAEIHPDKVGRVTVGTNIPIVHENDARIDADVFFVPNFGFKDMFVEKEKEWIDGGGTMIFAMPDVEIITGIKYCKNRIHTFGCSLTHQHNWRYLVKNNDPTTFYYQKETHYMPICNGIHSHIHWKKDDIHLTDYSMSGWGNDIQHIRYANEVYYNNISKDDIILWQISSPDRVAVITEDSSLYINRFHNVFTGEDINLVNTKELSNTTTYNTLWQLNGIKRNNDKLLVIFGWDSCFERGINQDETINEISEKNEIMKFLKEHDIDYIEESILGWSTRHKFLKPHRADIHPPQEGYKSFTEECLLPKLKKLKWLD